MTTFETLALFELDALRRAKDLKAYMVVIPEDPNLIIQRLVL